MQHRAIVPDVVLHGAVISVGIWGQRHQQVLHFLRVVRRHASGPGVIAYSAAVGACEERQQHQQALHPLRARQSQVHRACRGYLQCRHQRMQKGAAAPAGLTSLT